MVSAGLSPCLYWSAPPVLKGYLIQIPPLPRPAILERRQGDGNRLTGLRQCSTCGYLPKVIFLREVCYTFRACRTGFLSSLSRRNHGVRFVRQNMLPRKVFIQENTFHSFMRHAATALSRIQGPSADGMPRSSGDVVQEEPTALSEETW